MPQHPSFETLFRVSPNAYLLIDRERIIIDANAACLQLLGCEPQEVLGQHAQALFEAGSAADLSVALSQTFEGEHAHALQPLRSADGRVCWRLACTPVADSQNGVGCVLLHMDVVSVDGGPCGAGNVAAQALRCEEPARQKAFLQAQRLEVMGKLTGAIAHDFNNMLQVIGGNLQLLWRSIGDDPAARRRLESAISGVEKGARLASQLLSFATRQSLQLQVVDLDELIAQMNELLNGALGRAVTLDLDVQPGLWPLHVDVGDLQAAILDLASSAREAMSAGGELRLELRNAVLDASRLASQPELSAGSYVELELTCVGQGMDPDSPQPALEPFLAAREEDAERSLGMVDAFARQNGGFIERETGQGIRVSLFLPACQSQAPGGDSQPHPENAVQADREEEATMPNDALSILFVEDDPTLRMLTGEVMSELGHQVRLCESAEKALQALDEQRFDVLLTDVGLAGMSGVELARTARQRDPSLSVVIASGYAVDAREEGLEDLRLMLKPYDIHQVRTLLDSILDERQQV